LSADARSVTELEFLRSISTSLDISTINQGAIMRHVLHKETTAAAKPERERQRRDDGPVLEAEAVLAHLEADRETDSKLAAGGDPIKGIAIAAIAGVAIWISLAAALVLFWL
jgi:hypothetical protein